MSMTGTKEMVLQNTGTVRGPDGPHQNGVQTMTITKRLILSAVTAMTLGVGTAMAQSEVPAAGTPYWTLQRQIDEFQKAMARNPNQVQSGSSDVERLGAHVVPLNGDYSDLANPG